MRHPSFLSSALVALATLAAAPVAAAHFLWIRIEPGSPPGGRATIRAFLNEEPEPGSQAMLAHVAGVALQVGGFDLPLVEGEGAYEAGWTGCLPRRVDAERDMGVRVKDGAGQRLLYTARAQVGFDSAADETLKGLRVRLVERDGAPRVQVLFDGKPVPKARIKVYPDGAEPTETTADENGLADVPGVAEGKTGLWANWIDATPGQADGQDFAETRHYATLTFLPAPAASAPFATMPDPAVNSFGGAVQDGWLYVYSGHVGRVHRYSVDSTAKRFRRLSLADRTTWEDLPITKDLQGVALVSDGTYLYRTGGMAAHNAPGADEDTRSVADVARFDPRTKEWTDLPPLPQPRSTHDSIVIGRTLYVVGGWILKGADEDSEYCDTALALDLADPQAQWRTIPQPFQRRALAVAEAGGKLYVLGGLNSRSKVERRVDVFDPATGGWSLGPELPAAHDHEGFGPSACTVGGSLFYSGASGYLFRLDDRAGAWRIAGALDKPRITHRLLPAQGGALLAVGGSIEGDQEPVIESLRWLAAGDSAPGE